MPEPDSPSVPRFRLPPRKYLALAGGAALLHLCYSFLPPLLPQEAYYWCYSLKPAAGYLDHPPAVAFFIKAGTLIGGNSVFGIRLSAVISAALLSLAAYYLVKESGGTEDDAFRNLVGILVVPIFAVGSVMITPDVPQALFWMLTLLFLLQGINRNSSGRWYAAGIAGGAALASKYTSVLIAPAMLLFLISSRDDREWIKRKEPYIAAGLALLVFFPVFCWNATHDWASFAFQGTRRAGMMASFKPHFFFQLAGTQLLALSPLFFAGAWWMVYKGGRDILSRDAARGFRFLYFNFAFPFLFFFAASLRGQVKMNWPAPAYLTLLPLLAVTAGGRHLSARLARWAFGTALVFSILILAAPLVRIAPLGDADTWSGWKVLAERVDKLRDEYGRKDIFIFSNSHKTASELTFHLGDGTFCLGGNVLGLQGLQYDFWHDPANEEGKNAICAVWELDKLGKSGKKRLSERFEKVTRLDTLEIESEGRLYRKFYLYFCEGYRGPPR